jgi:DNA-binding IclR family transcriptional regulator
MTDLQVLRSLGNEPFETHTPRTITTYDKLLVELEKIRMMASPLMNQPS